MTCDQTEKISLLIDDELSPAEAREAERHLVKCRECQSARKDFLSLRSQIADYGLLFDSIAPSRVLAQIVSHHETTNEHGWTVERSSRVRWLGGLANLRFIPAFATVVVLLVAGAIVFVLYRAQSNSDNIAVLPKPSLQVPRNADSSTTPISGTGESSNASGSQDQVADNSRRKSLKGEPRETVPNQRKPSSRIKPTRERSSPKPLPQPFSAAPPTYAITNDRFVPGDAAAILSADSEL